MGGGEGAAGAAGAAGKLMPFMKSAGMVGLAAGAGIAVGEGINMAADAYTTKTNQYGQDSNIFERGFGKLFMSKEDFADTYGEKKVKIEVDSKDPQFSARPKSTDPTRDARSR